MIKWMVGGCVLALLVGSAGARETIKAGSISIDGTTVRALACEVEKGGLFATMAVVGTLAKQRKVLDACAPRGAAFRLKWTWLDGQPATGVEVLLASDDSRSACVVKAVQLTKGDHVLGDCQATLLVGEAAAAGKAADRLAPPAASKQP